MNSGKGIAIVLIVGGALALAYGGFSYTKDTHEGHIGSLDLTLKDREHVNIPAWAGIGAIVIGAGFLLVPTRKI
jgi:TRAP-type C4-dicarboxylate transport system permease small subunit